MGPRYEWSYNPCKWPQIHGFHWGYNPYKWSDTVAGSEIRQTHQLRLVVVYSIIYMRFFIHPFGGWLWDFWLPSTAITYV